MWARPACYAQRQARAEAQMYVRQPIPHPIPRAGTHAERVELSVARQ